MSNYEITEEDKKYIDGIQKNDPICRYLNNKDSLTFGVGDFLIMKRKTGDDRWITETVSHVNKTAKRFICIHEDDNGIKYLKAFSSQGEILPYIFPITTIESHTKYELDPSYAEHMILDQDNQFDASEEFKKKKKSRDAVTRANAKICKRLSAVSDVEIIFKDVAVGTSFYFGYNIPDAVRRMQKVQFESVNAYETEIGWGSNRVKQKRYELKVSQLSQPGQKYNLPIYTGVVFFFEEPIPYEA